MVKYNLILFIFNSCNIWVFFRYLIHNFNFYYLNFTEKSCKKLILSKYTLRQIKQNSIWLCFTLHIEKFMIYVKQYQLMNNSWPIATVKIQGKYKSLVSFLTSVHPMGKTIRAHIRVWLSSSQASALGYCAPAIVKTSSSFFPPIPKNPISPHI